MIKKNKQLRPSICDRLFKCSKAFTFLDFKNHENESEVMIKSKVSGTLQHNLAENILKVIFKNKDKFNIYSILENNSLLAFFDWFKRNGEVNLHSDYLGITELNNVYGYIKAILVQIEPFFNELILGENVFIEKEVVIPILSSKLKKRGIKDVYGTIDFAYLNNNCVHIIDLKTGLNPVNPATSVQLRLYAMGLINTLQIQPFLAILNVFQPLISQRFSVKKIPLEILEAEKKHYIKKVEDIYNIENHKFKTGNHCYYCPVFKICPAVKKTALKFAKTNFPEYSSFSSAELKTFFKHFSFLSKFKSEFKEFLIKSVNSSTLPTHLRGVVKVKITKRRKVDSNYLEAFTDNPRYSNVELFKRVPKDINELESILSKEDAKELFSYTYHKKLVLNEEIKINTEKEEVKKDAVLQ